MKKISLRSVLFSSYTLILAVLVTAYLHGKLYLLNIYLLPILVGAYYFDIYGGVGFALISCGLGVLFARHAGYSIADTPVLEQLIIFVFIGGVSGLFQRENNYLNNYLLNASLTDNLTKLYNYGYFSKRVSEETARAERYKRSVGLIMIDIDHFKKYNDTYGHQKGNEVLSAIAGILQKNVRQSDIVFRYGGEEFVVMLPETAMEAQEIAERLREKVAEKKFITKGGQKVSVSISLGVSYHPYPVKTQYDLVERSDKALYKAKETGRNKVCIYEG